jgi:hypothetical protein
MIHASIQTYTLEDIYAKHWGAPCKFKKEDGKWTLGRVGERTLKAVRNRECILLLKPIQTITVRFIEYLYKTIKEDFNPAEFTPERVQEFIDMLVNDLELTSYVTVDILRRQYYHVPIYNLNLFKCGIAEPLDERRWKEYEALKVKHKNIRADNVNISAQANNNESATSTKMVIDDEVEKDLKY